MLLERWKLLRQSLTNKSKSLFFIILFASCSFEDGKQTLFDRKAHDIIDSYWLYKPIHFDHSKSYPLIIFLMGGDGASSSNPNTVKDYGPAALAQKISPSSELFPYVSDSFLIINPHMKTGPREKRQWEQHAVEVLEILHDLDKKLKIDINRVYITGLSKGATGSFDIMQSYPNTFAASVHIAGRIEWKGSSRVLSSETYWVIQNESDPIVSIEYVYDFLQILETNNIQYFKNDRVALTKSDIALNQIISIRNNNQHDAWTLTYSSPIIYKWLLSKKIQR